MGMDIIARGLAASANADAMATRQQMLGVDYSSDKTSPLFIWLPEYIRSHITPTSFAEATIVSRNSDTQFTVSSGHGNRFAVASAFVVIDNATGRHRSFVCRTVSGDVVTIYGGPLPASISTAQTMHDEALGQHLSQFGYRGMADFVVDAVERFGYKKPAPLFAYNPALSSSQSFNTYNIRNFANTADIFTVTRVGTASGGGFVSGTTDLVKLCQNQDSNVNPAGGVFLFPRSYRVTDATAGSGVSVNFNAQGYPGFVEIPVAAFATAYTPTGGGSAFTSGRVRVEVLADGNGIFDQTYPVGVLSFARVNFTNCTTLTVRVTTADAAISDIRWYGAFGWMKSPRTPSASIFKNDDVIALYMDSWGEHILPATGDLRADGSTAGGQQTFQKRLAARLAADGVRATILNMSRGGQTSAWARYWAREVLRLNPRPTKVILHFAINDFNSNANVAGSTVSSFDFSPTNMWAQQNSNAGGVFGSVTYAQWFQNMEWLCDFFSRNGVQPVVLTPAITASISQTAILEQYGTARIAGGFEPFYSDEIGAP